MTSARQTEGTDHVLPYSYQSLPDINITIRILILDPGSGHAPLKGRLAFINAGSPSENYEPISYVWGNPNRSFEVLLHDHGRRSGPLRITESLNSALERFRYPDRERYLWADQVCINQDDNVERSQQVQLMARIYQNAFRVLVWLGSDSGNVALSALNLVQELDEIFQDENKARRFHVENAEDFEKQSRERWSALDHMTVLPWFSRGWIVQEIGFHSSATLFWGAVEFDWMVLHRVCEKLSPYQYLRSKLNIRTANIKYTYKRFIEPELTSYHANRFSFIYELHRARQQKVTDPRDRVFAFLGHYSVRAGGARLLSINADYDKTVEQVYIDTAQRTLLDAADQQSDQHCHDSALITLAAVQHISLSSSNDFGQRGATNHARLASNLPSWVPDWRNYLGFILSEPIHARRAQGTTTPQLFIDQESNILSIAGIRIDTINHCESVIKAKEFQQKVPTSSSTILPIQSLWSFISKGEKFNLEKKYCNGDSLLFAFMQTLSNGSIQNAPREGLPYGDIPKSTWMAHQAAYLVQAVGLAEQVCPSIHQLAKTMAAQNGYAKWSRVANGASSNRVFATTIHGYYVLGPKVMEPGDIVCVFLGGKMPFVVRQWGSRFLLVGECYVHGMMNEEAIVKMNQGEAEKEIFEII